MIGGIATSGSLATLLAGVQTMQAQQQTLAGQVSTGLISDDVGALGGSAAATLQLQSQMQTLQAYGGNVTAAQSRLDVAQTALGQIGTLAASLSSSLTSLSGTTAQSTLQGAVISAQSALAELGPLLNTSSGGTYVFSGIATDMPVIGDAAALQSGPLGDAVGAALDATGSGNLSAILSSAQADIPFSATLTTTSANALQGSTLIGPGDRLATGYVATQSGTASATSTGSPIRDLIAGLTVVANLTTDRLSAAQSSGLLSSVGTMVSGAAGAISDQIGLLGTQQQALTAQSTQLDAMSTALTSQYGTMTGVDLATVSTEQSSLSTQLTASFSLIADLKGLSLADFL